MKACGKTICKKGTVLKCGQTGLNTPETTSRGRSMATEYTNGWTEVDMKATGSKTELKALESTSGPMEDNTKGTG